MRILVLNVNTTASMTASIGREAASAASPGTEIVPLTPLFGAESVEGSYESYLAAVAVMETVKAYPEPYDAVIPAGYGEHGREGLQEFSTCPWLTSRRPLPAPRCTSATSTRWSPPWTERTR